MEIMLSDHAVARSYEWNLSYDDIQFVVHHAKRLHRAGVIFCQLHDKDIPDTLAPSHRSWRLAGTTVLLCSHCGQCVITVYRNQRAFHEDRQKSKKCLKRKQQCTCGRWTPQMSDD